MFAAIAANSYLILCNSLSALEHPPASDRPFDERLRMLLEFHRFLTGECARIFEYGLLAPAIRACDREED